MTDFEFKTTPYKHQLECFEWSKDAEFWGILFEQRCGKTKVALDTAAHMYHLGKINTLLIIAPNGVHRNWVTEEIPTHLHPNTNPMTVLWQSSQMERTVNGKRVWKPEPLALLRHGGLAILAVNVDAIITDKFREYLTSLFAARKRVMTVIDESLDISGVSSQRAKMAMKIGRRSVVRRILDGTPAAASPMGLYSQCEFLRPAALGFTNFVAFRARYAKLERRDVGERNKLCPDCDGIKGPEVCLRCSDERYVGKQEIQTVTGYQRLEELNEKLMRFSTRVTRAQCADLPPKVYKKVFFELTPTQRKAYDQLKKDTLVELRGHNASAALALTRLLRLQQIASNHLPIGDGFVPCGNCYGEGCETCLDTGVIVEPKRVLVVDEKADPRTDALLIALDKLPGQQGIVWCKFKPDVENVTAVLRARGLRVGQYYGVTSGDEREAVKVAFQRGELDVIVGTARAGGRGIDLSRASWIAYYSHDWSLRHRLQSEDRAQSLKKKEAVLYLDLVAVDTIDEKILSTLRSNKSFSDLVCGDPSVPWL